MKLNYFHDYILAVRHVMAIWKNLQHENQACLPSLSTSGKLHLGNKSDMLVCLEGKHSFQIPYFLLHVVRVGSRETVDYMNHTGAHFKKHLRLAIRDVIPKRLDCNAPLYASEKENVQ